MENGNPNLTAEGLINWGKKKKLAQILGAFKTFQSSCFYDIDESLMKSSFLAELAKPQAQPGDLYERSLAIEPREGMILDRKKSRRRRETK